MRLLGGGGTGDLDGFPFSSLVAVAVAVDFLGAAKRSSPFFAHEWRENSKRKRKKKMWLKTEKY